MDCLLDDDDSISPTYLESFYNEIHNVYAVDAILFRMRHPEYGVLPKTSSVDLVRYECGISFALKRKIFTNGLWFEPSHEEDYNLLCKIKEKDTKWLCLLMSNIMWMDYYQKTLTLKREEEF